MVLLVNKVVIIIIMMSNRPYSPDLNPIEEAFGWAKLWMKRNNDICLKYPRRCFEIGLSKVIREWKLIVHMTCSNLTF